MSCRYEGAGYVECLKEKCELWDKEANSCSKNQLRTFNELHEIREVLIDMVYKLEDIAKNIFKYI